MSRLYSNHCTEIAKRHHLNRILAVVIEICEHLSHSSNFLTAGDLKTYESNQRLVDAILVFKNNLFGINGNRGGGRQFLANDVITNNN